MGSDNILDRVGQVEPVDDRYSYLFEVDEALKRSEIPDGPRRVISETALDFVDANYWAVGVGATTSMFNQVAQVPQADGNQVALAEQARLLRQIELQRVEASSNLHDALERHTAWLTPVQKFDFINEFLNHNDLMVTGIDANGKTQYAVNPDAKTREPGLYQIKPEAFDFNMK